MPKKKNQNTGCLATILPFLFTIEKTTSGNTQDLPYGIENTTSNYPQDFPYRLRDDFLSPAEFSFYKVLSSLVSGRMVVLTKVRLADLFFVSRPNENMAYLNRIAQRHVDFVLCTPVTMKPKLGIELDDSSHKKESRQESDAFVDKVFESAGLPLLRMPAQQAYHTQDIINRLSGLSRVFSQTTADEPMETPASPTSSQKSITAPLCPKCGIPMVLRTAQQGKNSGKQFYGCPNFPRCREVIPV